MPERGWKVPIIEDHYCLPTSLYDEIGAPLRAICDINPYLLLELRTMTPETRAWLSRQADPLNDSSRFAVSFLLILARKAQAAHEDTFTKTCLGHSSHPPLKKGGKE